MSINDILMNMTGLPEDPPQQTQQQNTAESQQQPTPPATTAPQTTQQQTTQKPPNMVLSGYTTETPSISQTVTTTDYRETPTYEDWERMKGNEPWDEYKNRLGFPALKEPVYDEERERKLKQAALLRTVSQGLGSLGDMFNLSIGASVPQREIQPIKELDEIKTLKDRYAEQQDKYYNQAMNYFKIAQDYENARRGRYLAEREASSRKVSTSSQSGGRKEVYENQDLADLEYKRKLAIARAGKDKQGTSVYTHPYTYKKDGKDAVGSIKYSYVDKAVSPKTVRGEALAALKAVYNDLPQNLKDELQPYGLRRKTVKDPTTKENKEVIDFELFNTKAENDVDVNMKVVETLLRYRGKIIEDISIFGSEQRSPNAYYENSINDLYNKIDQVTNLIERIQAAGLNIYEINTK